MNTDAKNRPVIRGHKETDSRDIPVQQQRAPINLDLPREQEEVEAIETVNADMLQEKEYLAELAFNEEPITIIIQKGPEKMAPRIVDCWVNGRGAEHFRNGKWHVCGWLPVNVPVITRRKYVEVLARAKADSVETEVVKHIDGGGSSNGREDNLAHRYTQTKFPFSVLNDPSGTKGMAWLTKILNEQ